MSNFRDFKFLNPNLEVYHNTKWKYVGKNKQLSSVYKILEVCIIENTKYFKAIGEHGEICYLSTDFLFLLEYERID